jgi:hypothetical protein
MAQAGRNQQGMQVARIFEQPADAITLYSDFAQVIGTGSEFVLQFYESVPEPPGPSGQVQSIRSRLRATVVVSPAHAQSIGRLLLQQAEDPGSPGTSRGTTAGYA